MSVMTAEDFIEHYGVKGMKWGVRRSQRQLSRTARKGHKKADKLTTKARKREKKLVRQKESIATRQADLERIASGKLLTNDILELIGTANYITLGGAIINRQSYRKQYAQDQQRNLEGYKRGVARRETKTKEMRNAASTARKGANAATKQLALIGDKRLP